MKRTGGEELPTGGRTEIVWDDESGDFDLTEYDADGGFVRRIQRRYIDPDAPKGELVAQDIELDESGNEVTRTNHVSGEGPPPEDGGWSAVTTEVKPRPPSGT